MVVRCSEPTNQTCVRVHMLRFYVTHTKHTQFGMCHLRTRVHVICTIPTASYHYTIWCALSLLVQVYEFDCNKVICVFATFDHDLTLMSTCDNMIGYVVHRFSIQNCTILWICRGM